MGWCVYKWRDANDCEQATRISERGLDRFFPPGLRRKQPCDILILDFQPRLWDDPFILFKLPHLWYFVKVALAKNKIKSINHICLNKIHLSLYKHTQNSVECNGCSKWRAILYSAGPFTSDQKEKQKSLYRSGSHISHKLKAIINHKPNIGIYYYKTIKLLTAKLFCFKLRNSLLLHAISQVSSRQLYEGFIYLFIYF